MNRLDVDNEIYLEAIKIPLAKVIFSAIDRDRKYLSTWLPFVNQTKKKADTVLFLKSMTDEENKGENAVFAIFYRNEFAGLISLKDIDYINKKTEMGYWIAEKMQGKGIVTRSVRKLIDHSFRTLNLNRIQIKVAVGNKKSAAIPQKLGFRFEGIEHDGEFHSNKFLNLEVYSFLKKDWIETIKTG